MRTFVVPVAAFAVASLSSLPVGAAAADGAWSRGRVDVAADLAAGRPLVVHVVVPLCSNEQIDCGSDAAGSPGSLRTNLYWGAAFGARRFFERKGSGWEKVEVTQGRPPSLERAIYRRWVDGAPFGRQKEIEQLVVLEAIDGARIDDGVKLFWRHATGSGTVSFRDGDRARTARIHVAGYAGHNRLMDGMTLPKQGGETPVPSFVLACRSDAYFSRALSAKGSRPLVMTRTLMAPEGYVIDAVARGVGENLPDRELAQRAAQSYAKWQKISPKAAGSVFSSP
jgi:hypothetical protein